MNERVRTLMRQADQIQEQVKIRLPLLAAARRKFAQTKNDANWNALEKIQNETVALHEEFSRLVDDMGKASGLPQEILDRLGEPDSVPLGQDQLPRENLTSDLVEATADIDATLASALETVVSLLPANWLDGSLAETTRLSALCRPDAVLSLTKGLRPESEATSVHRFQQIINVSRDYLNGVSLYDHFAGALLVPSLVQLGLQMENLKRVGGDRDERLARLWRGPGREVDATLFELFTAANCAEMGRNVEFIEETSKRTPDIRCHDPYPLVIECKRQDPLSKYEVTEEKVMRLLYMKLRTECRRLGLQGNFKIRLTVEAESINLDEVVSKLVGQRFASHPQREQVYPWGRIVLDPLPRRVELPETTRSFSPNMLEYIFGWQTDLAEWDGICCSIENNRDMVIDEVQGAISLAWMNTSEEVIRKRTWAPTNLFGSATGQVPPGEFGIVYVAYVEGARAVVADLRLEAFRQRLKEWEHSADIRIPISLLCRLYPRPLGHGQPDLIESGVRYCAEYAEPILFEKFPTTVFSMSARSLAKRSKP